MRISLTFASVFINIAFYLHNSIADEDVRIENYTTFEKPFLQHKYFVDKSLLINDFLLNERYILVSRPRRWGKTLNMNMLEKFFQIQVDRFGSPLPENTNRILFEGGCFLNAKNETKCLKKLKISREFPEIVEQHQGKYPVIHLNFKHVFRPNYNDLIAALSDEIRRVYKEFEFLKKYYKEDSHGDAEKLGKFDKHNLKEYIEGSQNIDFQQGITLMIKALRMHFGTKIFVFIDDYDELLIQAYLAIDDMFEYPNLYHDYSSLLMNIISAIFEDRYHVRGMMTGVLSIRLPEEVLGESTLFDSNFLYHFGFTEEEIHSLLSACPHVVGVQFSDLKQWYNGYVAGNATLYNSGSVIQCLENEGILKNYQTETRGLEMIKKIPISNEIKYEFDQMIASNASIIADISRDIDLYSMKGRDEFYTYLYFCGYFKAVPIITGRYICSIPNLEMKSFLLENLPNQMKIKAKNK